MKKNGSQPFPQNIVLIGMFGSGKSTVGRALAQKLRYHFVDVDHLIEAKYRKPLQKVLDELGMKGFMKMEDATLRSLHYRHCVISPGGSAVYYPKGMAHLKKLGPRVFLRVSLGTLKRRLRDWSNRGVVCRGGSTLPALYKERAPLFRKYGDLIIEAKGDDAQKTATRILKALIPKKPVKQSPRKIVSLRP